MLQASNILLLGGAGRASGKTSFACLVIHRLAARTGVYAVKITPDPHDGLASPEPGSAPDRSGRLRAGFEIIEEARPSPGTDTGRMLEAGAGKAFWLIAGRDRLAEAWAALAARIPPGACIVAEGSSLRRVLKPGLFLLLRRREEGVGKDSFRELKPLADRIAVFDGSGWDLAPEGCRFVDGSWILRPPASAIVLAGGESRRMGRDKALLEVEGRPLIARIVDRLEDLFDEIVIGAARSGDYGDLGRPVIADRETGQGPLMGLASCLERVANELALVTACDIPRPDLRFAASLLDQAQGYDMVLPRSGGDHYEPLFAVYRRSVAPTAFGLLAAGERSILGLLDRVRVRVRIVPLPETVRLGNLNTPDDYKALSRRRL